MSADLYLIAHRVRGLPAFDIATQQTCAICQGQCGGEYIDCVECDSEGFWWIVGTSGHRAYPYWHEAILGDFQSLGFRGNWVMIPEMPKGLPDHYMTRASASAPTPSLSSLLNIRPTPLKVDRRF